MGTNFLQPLASKSAPSTTLIFTKPSIKPNQIFLPRLQRSLRVTPTNTSSTDNNEANGDGARPQAPPPNPVEIRFKRRSRRRSRQQREEDAAGNGRVMKAQASAPDPPKKWEDMSFGEKAIEVYVGEKGVLFWLNKLAYASIFIVIGGWILFRFVGPALNLYQLDSAPLAPTSVFKGS